MTLDSGLNNKIMQLSIIVLNYKSKHLVRYFLRQVLNFRFKFKWEIIAVDNASGDDFAETIKSEYPVVKVVNSFKNLGMGGGNNLGVRHARGRYLLIVNPDVTLIQSAIEELMVFLEQHSSVAVAAPQILNPDRTRQDSCYRWPHILTFLYRRTLLGRTKKGQAHLRHYAYGDCDLSVAQPVDWILGGCFMIRHDIFKQIGLFDERFFLFLEDTDLCRRLWRQGQEVWYIPQAKVIHLPHRLSAGQGSIKDIFSKLTWIHLISWAKYFWKWRKDGSCL